MSRYYAVVNIQPWASLTLSGSMPFPFKAELQSPTDAGEPCGFLAVFATEDAAKAWAQGDPIFVLESEKELR